MMPHDFLLSHVARILAEDDWFAAHRVRIIRQDSADLGEELAKSGAEVDGVSLVVAYDRETSIASSPRQFEVEFSLLAAEFPASNRNGVPRRYCSELCRKRAERARWKAKWKSKGVNKYIGGKA